VIWTDVAQFLLYSWAAVLTFGILLHRDPADGVKSPSGCRECQPKLRILIFSWNLATVYTFWSE